MTGEAATVEIVPASAPTVAIDPHVADGLYGTRDPLVILAAATAQAEALGRVIEEQHLYVVLGRDRNGKERKHIVVEGWQTVAMLAGVAPVVRWVEPTPNHVERRSYYENRREVVEQDGLGGYKARVEVVHPTIGVMGGAEALCSYGESNWRTRDDHQLASMAQTRAIGKAVRGTLAFIPVLAGYEATPAEEFQEASRPPHPVVVGKGRILEAAMGDKNLAAAGWAEAMNTRNLSETEIRAAAEGVEEGASNDFVDVVEHALEFVNESLDAQRTQKASEDAPSG